MFPDKSIINIAMPKSKLFSNISADSLFMRKYNESVDKFIWMYSLDQNSINMQPTKYVSKIDVLYLTLNKYNASDIKLIITKIEHNMLNCLSRRIYFCNYNNLWTLHIMYNSFEKGGNDYYLSGNINPDSFELPIAYNLSQLFENIVQLLVEIPKFPDEKLEDYLGRDALVKSLNKKVSVIERKMQLEKQPRKKYDLHNELYIIRQTIYKITSQNND